MAKNVKKEDDGLVDKLVFVNRVTKVVKGGKRMSFAAVVVVGDQKGRVGYGTGKGKEVPDAMSKALNDAKKNLFKVPLRDGRTLHHDAEGNFGSGKVILRTAPAGTGIIAGGHMRAIFDCMGIKDVVSKCLGSSNPHNVIKATFDALQKISSPRALAAKRGLKSSELVKRRDGEAAVADEA
jgi:small subunit ribosomal protein S5